MKKKKKGWIWIIVVVVVLAAALLLGRFLKPASLAAGTQQYETANVTKGDIQVTVHGTGSIEVMDTKSVAANATGKIDSVLVENGDAVKKGQLIATLNADELNSKITALKQQIITQDATIATMRANPVIKTLTAPVDATVKAIYAKTDEDATVSMSAKSALMVLSTDGKMKVSFVPDKGKTVAAGSAVKFVIGGKTLNGFITIVPDSTSDKAEAVLDDNNYSIGAKAVIKDKSGATLGSGKLEINRPLLITAYSGTVDRFYVSAGDDIKRGHRLVRLTGYILDANFEAQIVQRQQMQDDLNQDYEDLKDYSITAPADGIVTDLAIQENGTTQDGMPVCTIQENTGFKLVVAVDELDIPGIKIGQKADVKIDALPGQQATSEVVKISPIGDKANDVTTYNVTLKVTAPAGALANMNASADIEVASKTGVLLVPVEAIHTVNGKTYVYGALPYDVKPTASADPSDTAAANTPAGRFNGFFARRKTDANNARLQRPMIEVSVGLISDSAAEILSGLKEGDEIAVAIAQNTANSMFAFGGGRDQSANQGSSANTSSNSSSGK